MAPTLRLPFRYKKTYDEFMVGLEINSCKVAVFVCTNERPPEKVCCKKVGGHDFYLLLKERVKSAGLQHSHWICRTGCLGFCNSAGTTVAIFKQGQMPKWFNEIQNQDIDLIWREIQ
ncbi:(2Fe-2S) ferredoxin domain-containing protein [bacterium]|nr:(2Fe-2S) ferredoxin domain-containing protein [bacterium]